MEQLFGEDYEFDYFSRWEMPDSFEIIQIELDDYDEGIWTTKYIIQNKENKKYYVILQGQDSWEGVAGHEPIWYEVKPVEKLVVVYEKIDEETCKN